MQHVDEIFGRNVAGGRGREGATADAATTRVEHSHTRADRRAGICQPGVARVVKVRAQLQARHRRAQQAHDLGDLRWNGDTDGVGDGNFMRVSGGEAFGERKDARRRHFTFERAAEGRGNRDLRAYANAACGLRDLEPGTYTLIDAATLVPLTERLAGGDCHSDLGATGSACALETFAIEHETDVAGGGGLFGERRQNRFGIRHLRDSFRIHETRHFDSREAGSCQTAHELDFGGRGQYLRLTLQTVA